MSSTRTPTKSPNSSGGRSTTPNRKAVVNDETKLNELKATLDRGVHIGLKGSLVVLGTDGNNTNLNQFVYNQYSNPTCATELKKRGIILHYDGAAVRSMSDIDQSHLFSKLAYLQITEQIPEELKKEFEELENSAKVLVEKLQLKEAQRLLEQEEKEKERALEKQFEELLKLYGTDKVSSIAQAKLGATPALSASLVPTADGNPAAAATTSSADDNSNNKKGKKNNNKSKGKDEEGEN